MAEDVPDRHKPRPTGVIDNRDVTELATGHLVNCNLNFVVCRQTNGVPGHDLSAGDGVEVFLRTGDLVKDIEGRDDAGQFLPIKDEHAVRIPSLHVADSKTYRIGRTNVS